MCVLIKDIGRRLPLELQCSLYQVGDSPWNYSVACTRSATPLGTTQVGDSPWNYSVACTRVNRVMLVSLCAETIKPVFEGGKNLTAVGGNASVYQVYPVSSIPGEGSADFSRAWGPEFEQEGAGGGGGGEGETGGATPSVRGNYKSFKGANLTVVEEMHQFIMYIYPVSAYIFVNIWCQVSYVYDD